MWDAMIELLLVWVGLRIRLAYALGDYFSIALLMAGIFAVLTLHASRVFEKLAAESAAHDIVELLKHEFVAVQFMDFFFALTNSTFTVESNVERPSVFDLLGWKVSVGSRKYTRAQDSLKLKVN